MPERITLPILQKSLITVLAKALVAVATPAGAAFARANAESRPGATSDVIQAVYTGHAKSPGKIVCHAAVGRPNYFSPSHRSIATAAGVLCSSRVAGITFSLILTQDLHAVKQRVYASLGARSAQGVATYRCPTNRTHRYQGVMFGAVVFPPGYTPHERTFATASLPAHLRCRA